MRRCDVSARFFRARLTFLRSRKKLTLYERAAAPGFHGGFYQGNVADVQLSKSQENLHRTISAGTSDGGRTISRRAPAEHQSGNRQNALYFLQSLRARVP